jgi:hypothetical protein
VAIDHGSSWPTLALFIFEKSQNFLQDKVCGSGDRSVEKISKHFQKVGGETVTNSPKFRLVYIRMAKFKTLDI